MVCVVVVWSIGYEIIFVRILYFFIVGIVYVSFVSFVEFLWLNLYFVCGCFDDFGNIIIFICGVFFEVIVGFVIFFFVLIGFIFVFVI